ncbi:MAG: hypothetical protein RJB39_348 [Candidatus Parcubacteria bacterium]|jgi:hypothetical protein
MKPSHLAILAAILIPATITTLVCHSMGDKSGVARTEARHQAVSQAATEAKNALLADTDEYPAGDAPAYEPLKRVEQVVPVRQTTVTVPVTKTDLIVPVYQTTEVVTVPMARTTRTVPLRSTTKTVRLDQRTVVVPAK